MMQKIVLVLFLIVNSARADTPSTPAAIASNPAPMSVPAPGSAPTTVSTQIAATSNSVPVSAAEAAAVAALPTAADLASLPKQEPVDAKAYAEVIPPVRYTLNNLKPAGITQYSFPEQLKLRQYLHFQNSQGQHYIIYEESTEKESLREVTSLRQAMVNPDPLFRLELECKTKAVCTGECKNMYYQMTNTPNPNASPVATNTTNECRLLSFTNEKPGAERSIASLPGSKP